MGIGMAYNRWLVQRDSGYEYIRIYPEISANYFYQHFYPLKRVHGFFCLDTYLSSGTAWEQGKSGVKLELHPYLGFQFNQQFLGIRTDISPFNLSCGYYGNDWICEPSLLTLFTLFQISLFFHTRPSSNPQFLLGTRVSSSARAGIAGFGYQFLSRYNLRLEYSYSLPNKFLSRIWVLDNIGTVEGSVHYFTLGVFKKL